MEVMLYLLLYSDRERSELIRKFGLAVCLLGSAYSGILLLSQVEIPIDFIECSTCDGDILHDVLKDRPTCREVPSRA